MNIKSKQDLLLVSLLKFYSKDGNIELLLPIVKQQTSISLRLLDWLVTNYAKQNDVHYPITKNGSVVNFNIWLDYKNQLKAYSKRSFDPFCRRERVFFNTNNYEVKNIQSDEIKGYMKRDDGFVTTVGQLSFFRWALQNRVVDFSFDNLAEIESDMLKNADTRKLDKTKKRRELSKIKKGVSKHNIKVTIEFP